MQEVLKELGIGRGRRPPAAAGTLEYGYRGGA
jgi:hypothetical protein